MKLIPFVTALIVAAVLYLAVMERDLFVAAQTATEETAQETPARAADAPVSVVVQRSRARSVASGLVLRGRSEAARRVDVRAETSGLVVSAPLMRGAQVRAGEVMCELDPGTTEAQLEEARARLAEAETNNRASESLKERGFTTETAAIGRATQLASAQAAVARAETALEKLRISAPFDGLLETDTAELGSLLQPGSPCATLISLDPMKFVGFVPEKDIGRIALGAQAGARLVSGAEARGFVTFISRSADTLTRTFRIEVTVPNADYVIPDGMTAEILIALQGKPAHLLPESVLTLDDDGRLGVRAAQDGVARFYPAELLRDSLDGVFLAGLPDKLDVIVIGQDYVTDGRPVTVTYREVLQ